MYVEVRFYGDDGKMIGGDRIGIVPGIERAEHVFNPPGGLGGPLLSDDELLEVHSYKLLVAVASPRPLAEQEEVDIRNRTDAQMRELPPLEG